ncbi:MAG: tetratricopeptide repeat protein [Desulfovibrionaceae bacterium]|nr:tetratricopeptide repeat protein [Desulfovibrionaceae bacterium]
MSSLKSSSERPESRALLPSPAEEGLPLTRRDLLAFERLLMRDVARVVPCEAHALYFPTDGEAPGPLWIEEEKRLLLPLRRGNALLGVLLLRGPDPSVVAALLPWLPGLVDLWLDKLALFKASRFDVLTGLGTRAVLLEHLARELEHIRRAFAAGLGLEPEDGDTASGENAWQVSLGLLVLRLTGLRAVSRMHGHLMAERLLTRLGETLNALLPAEALAARTGDAEFAVLWPGALRQNMEELARDAVRALDGVRLPGSLNGMPARGAAHAGYVLFPQDWEGRAARESESSREVAEAAGEAAEEAATLLDKAGLAARRAADLGDTDEHVLGYGFILPRGGVVDQVLPLSRVRVTLGRDVGAREGQRFSVWSLNYPVRARAGMESEGAREPLYKGEIVLADVREDSSQADVLLLGDPAWPLEPGDRLTLLSGDGDTAGGRGVEGPARPDPLTGLYRHGDFLARLAEARLRYPAFGLVLARFDAPSLDREGRPIDQEHGMAEAAALLRRLLAERVGTGAAELPPVTEWPAGRYSLNGLLLFHPGLTPPAARDIYGAVGAELAERLGHPAAFGVACLPWLTYRAGDALECCRKALEYALLLPPPHVGVFDSLAVNISADKRYSQGDLFGALEEYRLALLADENNTLAWNSLGVCLAGVGRKAEARRAFEEAVTRSPGEAAGHYNLGTACAALGDADEAAAQFRTCVELDSTHLYACVRLGELAENRGDEDEARRLYERAAVVDPASSLPHRCLARLELRGHKPDKARECLHRSLLRNPQDAFSLHLMARLYLDAGEDPELAETLARQSVALRPDRKAAWLELARALEVQGRHRDAREARMRAANL